MTNRWQVETALASGAELGEGPIWDDRKQVLWWVNILAKEVHCYDPSRNEDRSFEVGQMVGSVVCRKKGGLMLALERGFTAFDPETGAIQSICDPEADRPDNRFNDGKCDPAGRFWAGTMHLEVVTKRSGALYSLEANHRAVRRLTEVGISNGIVWSSDGRTMYYIDTLDQRIDAFDYDLEEGTVANRRTVIEVPGELGCPDGMAIDVEDMLWVAIWGGNCVVRYDPHTGAEIGRVETPASNVTACAFGGPQLDRLYITTARFGLDPEALASQPQAGNLFVTEPGVKGISAATYRG